jgi:hypothetical protein
MFTNPLYFVVQLADAIIVSSYILLDIIGDSFVVSIKIPHLSYNKLILCKLILCSNILAIFLVQLDTKRSIFRK